MLPGGINLDDLLNETFQQAVRLLKKTEAEITVLRKDVKNQRILFSLGVMLFAVIVAAIIAEIIRNPNLYILMLIFAPVLILLGLRKQALKYIDMCARKREAENLVFQLRDALSLGRFNKRTLQEK